jgi:hypothetical protein
MSHCASFIIKAPNSKAKFWKLERMARLRGFFEISRHITDNLAVVAEVKTDLATGD